MVRTDFDRQSILVIQGRGSALKNSAKLNKTVHPDDLIRRLISGGSWAFLAKLTTYPLGLILVMVLARLLPETEMGGYFLCMSMIILTSGLVQAGLGATILPSLGA